MLVDEPIYMKPNCSPMCEHDKECVRCHRPKCIKSMMHSRLYGYSCMCGSQEWKPVFDFINQRSGLTMREPDKSFKLPCKVCGKPIGLAGHVNVADVDGKVIVTSAYCPEHWQKLGE